MTIQYDSYGYAIAGSLEGYHSSLDVPVVLPLADAEPDYAPTSSEDFARMAEAAGFAVVYPNGDEIFVDIDTLDQRAVFDDRLKRLALLLAARDVVLSIKKRRPSKSGYPKEHVTLTVRRRDGTPWWLTDAERLLFQSVLGSDATRELLGVARWVGRDSHPSLFIEKK